MESLKKLASAIGAIPTVGAQAAHIALLKERLGFVLQDIAALENENAELKQRLEQLEHQPAAKPDPADHAEYRGALFKRKPGGGYEGTPTCPACFSVMVSFQGVIPFRCGNQACRQQAGFSGRELSDAMAALPED